MSESNVPLSRQGEGSGVRLRFAPSPTGYLHVGGARTALFNWLYARRVGGAFLLRIEDTDKARSSDEHTQVILDGLTWLGLDWDEDVVFQGARVERHRDVADQLLAAGHAYAEEGAVRLRMPQGEIAWDDTVHGPISFQGVDVKDWIILRSDRTPTYNFSVVVDDIDMKVTQVMRGDDHISNTPKQIAVYRALGVPLPAFGHVPMIHGMDGKKLSKRHGATAVGDYQQLGILPAAMRNFLALLGWSPGGDRELFYDIKEMTEAFTLEGIQRKAAIFDTKKLEWMNGQHLTQLAPAELLPIITPILTSQGFDPAAYDGERILRAIQVVRERSRTTLEVARQVAVRLGSGAIENDPKAAEAIAKDPAAFKTATESAARRLAGVPEDKWEPTQLEAELRALAESFGIPAGKVFQPIRIALTGGTVSEPVHDLIWAVGKTETLSRLKAATG
ncbi:MAG: glutamate--tRNA ligase [Gemmatimonadetes bacterium]|nr:glutamate--tRNA ligase [Gemmatimonadota bacterium]